MTELMQHLLTGDAIWDQMDQSDAKADGSGSDTDLSDDVYNESIEVTDTDLEELEEMTNKVESDLEKWRKVEKVCSSPNGIKSLLVGFIRFGCLVHSFVSCELVPVSIANYEQKHQRLPRQLAW